MIFLDTTANFQWTTCVHNTTGFVQIICNEASTEIDSMLF